MVPAIPLPDNAVDDVVAKLDGIAEDLMKQSRPVFPRRSPACAKRIESR